MQSVGPISLPWGYELLLNMGHFPVTIFRHCECSDEVPALLQLTCQQQTNSKEVNTGTSLVAQGLRVHPAMNRGSIPGRGTKISHATEQPSLCTATAESVPQLEENPTGFSKDPTGHT